MAWSVIDLPEPDGPKSTSTPSSRVRFAVTEKALSPWPTETVKAASRAVTC